MEHHPVNGDEFRRILGHLPTGVAVITAYGEDGPVGMAANSVASVSLDPPLVLSCPAKSSTTGPSLRAAGRFCINIMASHHEQATRRFAAKGADRFAGVAWVEKPSGPALEDAIAWIECSMTNEHDAGDHTIVVAAVAAMQAAEGSTPLVFYRGGYGTFLPSPVEPD
jgi:3-hydroxy-9,10-secoandrosta-1,3,5(10)-triene-9,17-dione monooxygenase reductase component